LGFGFSAGSISCRQWLSLQKKCLAEDKADPAKQNYALIIWVEKGGERVMRDVFTIVENPNSGKDFWIKIGVAFKNKDGSENVILHATPVNGKMQIRDRKDKNNS